MKTGYTDFLFHFVSISLTPTYLHTYWTTSFIGFICWIKNVKPVLWTFGCRVSWPDCGRLYFLWKICRIRIRYCCYSWIRKWHPQFKSAASVYIFRQRVTVIFLFCRRPGTAAGQDLWTRTDSRQGLSSLKLFPRDLLFLLILALLPIIRGTREQ